jgi:beta-galactosidase
VNCSNPNVWTSLRTAGEHSLLFLMNLLSSPQQATLSCRPAWAAEPIELGPLALAPMTVECIKVA